MGARPCPLHARQGTTPGRGLALICPPAEICSTEDKAIMILSTNARSSRTRFTGNRGTPTVFVAPASGVVIQTGNR
jgi:hypothetical protein